MLLDPEDVFKTWYPFGQLFKTYMPSTCVQLPNSNSTVFPPAVQSPPAGQLKQVGSAPMPDGLARGSREYEPGLQTVQAPARGNVLPASKDSTDPRAHACKLDSTIGIMIGVVFPN